MTRPETFFYVSIVLNKEEEEKKKEKKKSTVRLATFQSEGWTSPPSPSIVSGLFDLEKILFAQAFR